MDSNFVPVTTTLSVRISWKDIPTLSKHRKYIPLSNPNHLSNPKSFPCRNVQNQVLIKYFFLINILVQLTFSILFLVTFFLFLMVISFMLPWKNLSHRALALACGSYFTMQTREKMKRLLQRFKLYFTVDKKRPFSSY